MTTDLPSQRPNGYTYRLVPARGHPLATSGGVAYVHRINLYARIGPGPHRCHWCNREVHWRTPGPSQLTSDHLDHDPTNNDPANLVPACRPCNSSRIGVRPASTPPVAGEPTWKPSRDW